jgi:hypothetical protein
MVLNPNMSPGIIIHIALANMQRLMAVSICICSLQSDAHVHSSQLSLLTCYAASQGDLVSSLSGPAAAAVATNTLSHGLALLSVLQGLPVTVDAPVLLSLLRSRQSNAHDSDDDPSVHSAIIASKSRISLYSILIHSYSSNILADWKVCICWKCLYAQALHACCVAVKKM